MPTAGRKITVQIGDDPDALVEYSIPETITTFEGSGPKYQARVMKLNNGDDFFSRTVAIREIHHKKRLKDDDDDDKDTKINVEVILEMTTEEGSGPTFRRRISSFNPNDETNGRKFHIKRLYGKNPDGTPNKDLWVDDKRWDEFTTTENSGPMFWRRIWKFLWEDESDDNDFDKNDLTAAPPPTDIEKAYRVGLGQDIVNVSTLPPDVLVLIISRSYETQDNIGLDGHVTLSATTTKHKPAPNDAELLYPPITNANVEGKYQQRIPNPPPPAAPLTTVPIVNPASGAMLGKLLAWTKGIAFGDGQNYRAPTPGVPLGTPVFNDQRIALFVNIKKLFPTKSNISGAHGDITIKIPGFNHPAFLYRIQWTVEPTAPAVLLALYSPDVYFNFTNGTDSDIQFTLDQLAQFGATGVKVFDAVNSVNEDYPVTVGARHHLPAGIPLPSGDFSLNEYFVPANWQVIAYTFRKNKDFPIDADNNLNLAKLAAKKPPVTPKGIAVATHGVVSNDSLPDATVRVRVKFPDLGIEATQL